MGLFQQDVVNIRAQRFFPGTIVSICLPVYTERMVDFEEPSLKVLAAISDHINLLSACAYIWFLGTFLHWCLPLPSPILSGIRGTCRCNGWQRSRRPHFQGSVHPPEGRHDPASLQFRLLEGYEGHVLSMFRGIWNVFPSNLLARRL